MKPPTAKPAPAYEPTPAELAGEVEMQPADEQEALSLAAQRAQEKLERSLSKIKGKTIHKLGNLAYRASEGESIDIRGALSSIKSDFISDIDALISPSPEYKEDRFHGDYNLLLDTKKPPKAPSLEERFSIMESKMQYIIDRLSSRGRGNGFHTLAPLGLLSTPRRKRLAIS
jgi:hypothetical protein